MTVTQKSPKQFRFTFVSRMQNLALDGIEKLYRANDMFVGGTDKKSRLERRLEYQHEALTSFKLLGYIAMLSMEQNCILPKQFEFIAGLTTDCINLTGAWINSDTARFTP